MVSWYHGIMVATTVSRITYCNHVFDVDIVGGVIANKNGLQGAPQAKSFQDEDTQTERSLSRP
jgi:hypothetical protein